MTCGCQADEPVHGIVQVEVIPHGAQVAQAQHISLTHLVDDRWDEMRVCLTGTEHIEKPGNSDTLARLHVEEVRQVLRPEFCMAIDIGGSERPSLSMWR